MVQDPETQTPGEYSDEQLEIMSLHAITDRLGNEGLCRRFELEKSKFSPEQQELLDKAYDLAMQLHKDDVRKSGEPATSHLLRVAIRVIHHFGVKDVNTIAGALLHDSLEEHVDELAGYKGAMIEEARAALRTATNEEVEHLVYEVTNPEEEEGKDRLEQYWEHVPRLLKGDPKAAIIKISDFIDNAAGLIYAPSDATEYRATRYLPVIDSFKEAVMRPDVPLADDIRQKLLEQLEKTRERLIALHPDHN